MRKLLAAALSGLLALYLFLSAMGVIDILAGVTPFAAGAGFLAREWMRRDEKSSGKKEPSRNFVRIILIYTAGAICGILTAVTMAHLGFSTPMAAMAGLGTVLVTAAVVRITIYLADREPRKQRRKVGRTATSSAASRSRRHNKR